MYLSCLENGGWCRLVLEGRKDRQNFKIDCREPAPASTSSSIPADRRRRRNHHPNPRRQERERRRREAWLQRRETRQQQGPLVISTAATAIGTVAEAAGDFPAARAATITQSQAASSSHKEKAAPTIAPKQKKTKACEVPTRCSTRTTAKKKTAASPEIQRAAPDLECDLNLSYDLDRDLRKDWRRDPEPETLGSAGMAMEERTEERTEEWREEKEWEEVAWPFGFKKPPFTRPWPVVAGNSTFNFKF